MLWALEQPDGQLARVQGDWGSVTQDGDLGFRAGSRALLEEMPSLQSLNYREKQGMCDKSRKEVPARATTSEHIGQKGKVKRLS